MGECINYMIAIFFIFYVLGCTYAEPGKADKKSADLDEKIDKKIENINKCLTELKKNKMVTLDNGVWKPVSNWENTCSNFTYFSGFIQSTFEKKQIEPVSYCKSFEKSTNIITEDENAEKKLAEDACFNELEEKEFVSYDKKHGLWKNTEHWSTKANNYLYFSGFIKSCLGNLTIGPVLFCNSRSELTVNNTVTYYNSLNKV